MPVTPPFPPRVLRRPTAAAWSRPLGSRRRRAGLGRAGGFTMVELVAVMILVAILAAVAVPRMGPMLSLSATAWRDQVLAALLHARTRAEGHRRLVCVSLAVDGVQLSQAAANPAVTCTLPLAGPDGDARWAHDSQGLGLAVSPPGTLYMQPDGRITSDGAGQTPVNVSITIAGELPISVVGETGHVQ